MMLTLEMLPGAGYILTDRQETTDWQFQAFETMQEAQDFCERYYPGEPVRWNVKAK